MSPSTDAPPDYGHPGDASEGAKPAKSEKDSKVDQDRGTPVSESTYEDEG